MKTNLSLRVDVPLDAAALSEVLLDELGGLATMIEPGRRIAVQLGESGGTAESQSLELRLDPIDGGTRLTLMADEAGSAIGDPAGLGGWVAGQVIGPLLATLSVRRQEDWITDRRARRPSGAQARGVYREPLYHYPNFRVILAELALSDRDYLLEVGCGGGALLHDALKSGCRAAAIDHSPDMVRLARDVNNQAVAEGRLTVQEAGADRLPFADATFTCAMMTGVLGFLPDAVASFREIRRVLKPGGRFVALGSDPALRGTPAAPEPIASRLRFYSDEQLRQLAIDAGFEEAQVVRRDMLSFAREVGIPQEHLSLFSSPAPFLVACVR